MSVSLCLTPFTCFSPQSHLKAPLLKLRNPSIFSSRKLSTLQPIRSVQEQFDRRPANQSTPRWENMLSFAASLYPLYVTAGGVIACVKPSLFAWFVERGPSSYSISLGLIMLSMGITLKLKDFFNLFLQRPYAVSLYLFFLYLWIVFWICLVGVIGLWMLDSVIFFSFFFSCGVLKPEMSLCFNLGLSLSCNFAIIWFFSWIWEMGIINFGCMSKESSS